MLTLLSPDNVSCVTTMAATVDTLTLADGANEAAICTTKGGEDYFFVQGVSACSHDKPFISVVRT